MQKRINLVESLEQDKERINPDLAQQFIKAGSVDNIDSAPITVKPESSTGQPNAPVRKKTKTAVIKPALIAIHVRVKPEIAAALKSASLDRQMKGHENASKKDIVEEALEPWLTSNGFLVV